MYCPNVAEHLNNTAFQRTCRQQTTSVHTPPYESTRDRITHLSHEAACQDELSRKERRLSASLTAEAHSFST